VHYMLGPEVPIYAAGEGGHAAQLEGLNWVWRLHFRFNDRFENFRERYREVLEWSLHHRKYVMVLFICMVLGSGFLVFFIGEDFFPYVDSGQMRLHVRAPEGTRIEETEQLFAQVEDVIRNTLPPGEIDLILDNIGLPSSGISLVFSDASTIGAADGDILIALKENHGSTRAYMRKLRSVLNEKFPQDTFFFAAANMTNQILNFGLPAPIDVQVVGRDQVNNYKIAQKMLRRIQAIPGVVDARIHEEIAYPTLNVNVDRDKAQQFGLTQRDVASSMLISLSGSYQTAPNQWLNLQNGVNYSVTVQTPQYKINSIDAMQRTPVTHSAGGSPQLLSSMATVERGVSTAIVDHYNVQPVYDIFCDADLRDLGGVARAIQKVVDEESKGLPKGSWSVIRGQVKTMQDSFVRLGIGIAFAVVFVYLLMVVNFQSWLDPFIILMALPMGFAGILWMLYITQTTFNVPSLMGIIMAIGVATANSILVVTFANDERATGKGPFEAALSAGYTRLRPVCMTALAMIIGMLPMSLALGEGGEQNAPLGRAVIGGLLFATFGTLFIVPIFYTIFRKRPPVNYDEEIQLEYEEELPEGTQPA